MTAHRAIRLSLAAGILVFGLKLLAWRITGSVALYSDALDSVVNIAGALVAVVAVSIAAVPADWNHPWGHAKAEYLSAITEGVLVAAAAVAILHEAWLRLRYPAPLESFGAGAVVAIAASAVNAGIAVILRRVGERSRSPALLADSAHVLSDVWTSTGILAGVAVTRLTRFWVLDPIIAAGLTANIAWSGWKILRASLAGLMDEAAPAEVTRIIVAATERVLPPGARCSDLRARRAGAYTFVEMKLFVSGEMTVAASHAICNRIEEAIEGVVPGSSVVVHVEPFAEVSDSAASGLNGR